LSLVVSIIRCQPTEWVTYDQSTPRALYSAMLIKPAHKSEVFKQLCCSSLSIRQYVRLSVA